MLNRFIWIGNLIILTLKLDEEIRQNTDSEEIGSTATIIYI